MSIHRRFGRFRAVIAVVVLAVGGLAAVSASSQPAAAVGGCTPSFGNAIPDWSVQSVDHPAGGVTLCNGSTTLSGVQAWLQIVDLAAGAKVRLLTDWQHASCGNQACNYDKFPVKTVDNWASWIGQQTGQPSGLFSVSNAGFFTDTSGSPSPLSVPYRQVESGSGGGLTDFVDQGLALTIHTDPGWNSDKRGITFGDTLTAPKQQVQTFDFPKNYTGSDIFQHAPCSDCQFDSGVGFTPDYAGVAGSSKRRTYVGTSGDVTGTNKVYILDTVNEYTVGQAQTMLKSFGSQQEVQFDGGGSTQLFADGKFLEQASCEVVCFGRAVPQVLAVYGAGAITSPHSYPRLQFVANHYQGVSTRIDILNAGTASATVALRYYNDDGVMLGGLNTVTIAAHSTWTLPAGAAGQPIAPGTAGTADILSSSNKLKVSVVEVPDAGGDPSTFERDGFLYSTASAPVISKGALGGKNTVLRLYNVLATATTVRIDYRDQSGTLVAQTQSSLPAQGRRDFDTAAVAALPAGFLGSATVQSLVQNTYFNGIVDEVGPGSARSTYNLAVENGSQDTVPAVFNQPNGITSSLTMQNTSTQNQPVTVKYFDATGQLVAIHSQTIPALGSIRFDQSAELPPSTTGYSALISTNFGVIVPVVELAGPNGGADAYQPRHVISAGGQSSIYWPIVENAGTDGWTTTFAVHNPDPDSGGGGFLNLYRTIDGQSLSTTNLTAGMGGTMTWPARVTKFFKASDLMAAGTDADAELTGNFQYPSSHPEAIAIQQSGNQLLVSLPSS
jgi:hypothetical protein